MMKVSQNQSNTYSKKNRERYLNSHVPMLFSFAYAIIPDDLQAQQAVLDAFSRYFVDKDEKGSIEDDVNNLYSNVYGICKRRFGQLKDSLQNFHAKFFLLEVQERAILFLRHQVEFEIEDIALILETTTDKVLKVLHKGRAHLLKTTKHWPKLNALNL